MSNPDFPGPYWQDKPEPYDGGAASRNGASDGFGGSRNGNDGSGDGWPGEWTRNPGAASGGGSRHARSGRNGRGGRSAPRNGSSYPVNGGQEAYDAAASSGGRRGRRDRGHAWGSGRSAGGNDRSAGSGDRSAGRVSRAGYVSSDYGSARDDANGRGYDGARGYDDAQGYDAGGRGYDDPRGYDANGRGHDDLTGNGYGRNELGRNGYGAESYAASGDAGYGSSSAGYGSSSAGYGDQDIGYGNDASGYRNGGSGYGSDEGTRAAYGPGLGGYEDGYSGGPTAYFGGTQLPEDGLPPLPGEDGWGPDGPSGPVGPKRRRPGGPGGSWWRNGNWWRHWTLKKVAVLMGCLALVMVLVMIAGFFYVYNYVQLPIQALSQPFVQSTVVYFSDGKTPVGCFCSTNRTVLSASKLGSDKYLEQAFFAAEDRHFLTEGGISLTGTARALIVDLTGSGVQGGSTITEQYVKTYFSQVSGGGNLTWKEKIKEIIDAIKLARLKPKQWILSHYLNAIYLGNQAYGVEAAAQTYFGKHAWQLGAAKSAMLAAMVQEPSGFDPYHPTKQVPGLGYSLLDRWVYVLGNMARDKLPNGQPVLTQQQYHKLVPNTSNHQADLKNFPKVIPFKATVANWGGFRGYIMNAVLNELEGRYNLTQQQIYNDGLQVVTTFNERKMHDLYAAVAQAKRMMRQGNQRLPWYAHVGAILENAKTGAIEASYPGPGYTSKHCKKLYCKFDMAMQSRNQVGSSFKPYVLAAAVKEGMNVKTSVLNGYSPLCVPPETEPTVMSKRGPASSCPKDGVGWLPVGYDPVVMGPVSVADAAARSSNAAFEDLAHRVGTTSIIHLAKLFGVDISHANSQAHPNSYGSGLIDDVGKIGIALGIAPLTVEEQATTFATLADGGVYHTPHVIAKITQNGKNLKLKVIKRRVLTPAQNADVSWALSFDTIYGTGVPNAQLSPPRPTIAKTGTTDVAQSAFFIGAFPGQISMAVGMFTNIQNNTKGSQTLDVLPYVGGLGGGYGGAWPATIWRLAMTRLLAHGHYPMAQLAPPNTNGFQKWVQVLPPKPKCPKNGGGPGQGNNGPGNGNGHGHHHGIVVNVAFGKSKCPSPSPTPNPTTSSSPPPSPTPSPSITPSPTISPSPSPPGTFPAKPANAPSRKSASGTPSLTTSATLPRPAIGRPIWVALMTGLA